MKRIFAALLAMLLLCCGALAEVESLKVTGTGTVYVTADRASASLGVTMTGEDLGELQQQVNETVSAICTALQAAGLDEKDISTNYIYISPRYDYSGDTEKMVGYTINNSLTISTGNIDSIGAYIDAAFSAGANTFDSIAFTVKDDTEARRQALELAVMDAMDKAEVIAGAAGRKLGGIVEISEGSQQDYYYNSTTGSARYAESAAGAVDAGTTVRAAQVNVTASVGITYAMAAE